MDAPPGAAPPASERAPSRRSRGGVLFPSSRAPDHPCRRRPPSMPAAEPWQPAGWLRGWRAPLGLTARAWDAPIPEWAAALHPGCRAARGWQPPPKQQAQRTPAATPGTPSAGTRCSWLAPAQISSTCRARRVTTSQPCQHATPYAKKNTTWIIVQAGLVEDGGGHNGKRAFMKLACWPRPLKTSIAWAMPCRGDGLDK